MSQGMRVNQYSPKVKKAIVAPFEAAGNYPSLIIATAELMSRAFMGCI
jgi:hypothetical protein